jgi:hypothetical protein
LSRTRHANPEIKENYNMTSDLGQPLGHREIINRINAQKAAEAKAANEYRSGHQNSGEPQSERPTDPHNPGQKRCRISAFRDETTGQFYAMSQEDRIAFDAHCMGIVEVLQPVNHHERWLATSIAEDQWRLNRARALESNIFAIGMSNPMLDVDPNSPETQAAISQARTWLADGKKLQMLALYEQRIRRSIEKNEKQLKELQAERKAAYEKALEEEILLAQLAIAEGETYVCEQTESAKHQNGFEFSTTEILRLANRELRLQKAIQYKKQLAKTTNGHQEGPIRTPKAA